MSQQDALADEQGKNVPDDSKDSQDTSETPKQIPPEILKGLPPELQSKLKTFFSMSMTSMSRTGVLHPLSDKITSEHVSKFLDYSENDEVRRADSEKSTRKYVFTAFIISVLILTGLIVLFFLNKSNELVVSLLIAIFAFLGGFGGGFATSRIYKK